MFIAAGQTEDIRYAIYNAYNNLRATTSSPNNASMTMIIKKVYNKKFYD